MAIPQSKKLGLDLAYLDPNLEARLRNIEKALERKVTTPTTSQAATETPFVEVPASISGLRLVSNVGTIQVTWDETEIANLLHYEIQAAKDTAFSSGLVIEVHKDRVFTFQEGEPGTVYFVRVRAVTQGGIDGDFSLTLNTATGQAATGDIGEGAVTTVKIADDATAQVGTVSQVGSFEAVLDTYNTVMSLSFTKDEEDSSIVIEVGGFMDAVGGAITTDVKIVRDSTDLTEVTSWFLQGALSALFYVPFVDSGLAAGNYTYTFQVQRVSGGLGTATMTIGVMVLEEVKK